MRSRSVLRTISIAVTELLVSAVLTAQPPAGAVARSESAAAAVSRKKTGGQFEALTEKAPLKVEELLILLPGASLVDSRGVIRLTSRADFEGSSPLPVLETAIVLHQHAQYDLDVTLDRGRIELENRKAQGDVRVLVRFHRQRWLMTLARPGTKVAVELSGRWAPGTRYVPKPAADHEPLTSAITLVVAGEVEVDTNESTFALTAPPGPAMLLWESHTGPPRAALRLEKLPGWANPEAPITSGSVESRAAVDKFRRLWSGQPDQAIPLMLASEHEADRRVGLIAAGAFDELAQFSKAETSHPTTLDFGVSVLRHWLGRSADQPEKLYAYLTGPLGYKPAQAETLIALLNGFTRAELERPETYEVLIEYLRHERPPIRALAAWHLVRLVPAGKEIPFAGTSKKEMEVVYKRWKDLIPSGQLPPGIRK